MADNDTPFFVKTFSFVKIYLLSAIKLFRYCKVPFWHEMVSKCCTFKKIRITVSKKLTHNCALATPHRHK